MTGTFITLCACTRSSCYFRQIQNTQTFAHVRKGLKRLKSHPTKENKYLEKQVVASKTKSVHQPYPASMFSTEAKEHQSDFNASLMG